MENYHLQGLTLFFIDFVFHFVTRLIKRYALDIGKTVILIQSLIEPGNRIGFPDRLNGLNHTESGQSMSLIYEKLCFKSMVRIASVLYSTAAGNLNIDIILIKAFHAGIHQKQTKFYCCV